MNPNITAMAFVFNLLQPNQTDGLSAISSEVFVNETDRLPSWGGPYETKFLDGLPLNEIESFVDIQLNRTTPRNVREKLLRQWAKKQGNEIEKKYRSFVSELNKRQTIYLRERGNEICKEVRRELSRVYKDKALGYRDVCEQVKFLAEDVKHQIENVGEDSPLHVPCSVDDDLSTEIGKEDCSGSSSSEGGCEDDKIESAENKSEQSEENDNKTKKHVELVF